MNILIPALLVLIVFLIFVALDQRARRREAEDDLVLERNRVNLLHGQLPYPPGERLP